MSSDRKQQSKATVRLKEDMKKIVAAPLTEPRNSTYKKLFGVSLQELHQQGLTENGVPAVVRSLVEYLTMHDDRHDAQESSLRDLIKELPDPHYCLLKYLCQFLTKVAKHHVQNRMNLHNLATVFGPNCFHVPPGLEGMKEQDLCNKIMAKILENYNTLFEVEYTENDAQRCENLARLIIVKEANCKNLPILLKKDFERDAQKPSPKTRIYILGSENTMKTCP